jgi:hypothetical protein
MVLETLRSDGVQPILLTLRDVKVCRDSVIPRRPALMGVAAIGKAGVGLEKRTVATGTVSLTVRIPCFAGTRSFVPF